MRSVVLPCLLVVACRADLAFEDAATITCEAPADCPRDWVCLGTASTCVRVNAGTPPHPTSASAVSSTEVVVTFDQPMLRETLLDVAQYAFTPRLTVLDAVPVEGDRAIRLHTLMQVGTLTYQLTLSGMTNLVGDALVATTLEIRGFGAAPDTTPPALVAPSDGARFSGSSVPFVWSARQGAHEYAVEVARDAAFTDIVATTFVEETSASLTLPPGFSYRWRVRSDASALVPEQVLESRRVIVLGDSLYVYCPAGVTCDPGARDGTRNVPFENVARALDVAVALGIDEVRIAGRGDGWAYEETVSLFNTPSVLGGYAPDFAEETRSRATFPTILHATPDNGHVIYGGGAVTLTGIVFVGADTGSLPTVTLRGAGEGLLLRDLEVRTGAGSGLRVEATVGDGPRLEDIDLFGNDALSVLNVVHFSMMRAHVYGNVHVEEATYAISDSVFDNTGTSRSILKGSFELTRSTFRAAGTNPMALEVGGRDATIDRCRFDAEGTGDVVALGADGKVLATNSVFVARGGSDNAAFESTAEAFPGLTVLRQCTLAVEGHGAVVRAAFAYGDYAVESTVLACSAPENTVGIDERYDGNGSTDPDFIENVLVAGCGTPYIDNASVPVSDPNTLDASPGIVYANNVVTSAPPSALFDAAYRPTDGPDYPTVRDFVRSGAKPADTPHDFDGTPRTQPASVGAFEVD